VAELIVMLLGILTRAGPRNHGAILSGEMAAHCKVLPAVSCAERVLFEIKFGMLSQVRPVNHALDGVTVVPSGEYD